MSDLELALHLADVADRITTARFRARDLSVDRKPDRTPVTDADTAVEDAVRRVLADLREITGVTAEPVDSADLILAAIWAIYSVIYLAIFLAAAAGAEERIMARCRVPM